MVVPIAVCFNLPSLNLLSKDQPMNLSLAPNEVTSEPKHITPNSLLVTLSLTKNLMFLPGLAVNSIL